MTNRSLTSLRDDESGCTIVICEGHVDRAEFAKRVDTDDVADILGDDFESEGSYPSPADESKIAEMTRHSWGKWRVQGKRRFWEEIHKDEPGAKPFTVVDQEGRE